MTATIGICLATCNGARFLQEQLDSIAAQTFCDWHLYVRDDVSDDATPTMLAAFARKHPGKVSVIADGLGRLGARENFAHLLGLVATPYIAFADQDDIWRPQKLARALSRIRALEAVHPPGKPVMVHADRRLVNAAGREIAASYWASRGLTPGHFPCFESHLGFCLAAGAAMLVNRPLRDRACPIPSAAMMHDTWVELVAHAFGVVGWIDEIALDHRRHGANTSGTSDDIDSAAARRLWRRGLRLLSRTDRQRATNARYIKQALAFRQRFGADLDAERQARLDAFVSLPEMSFPGRALALRASRAAPPGTLRTLSFAVLSAAPRPVPVPTHGTAAKTS